MHISFFSTKPWEKEHLEKVLGEKMPGTALSFTEEKLDAEHIPIDGSAEVISVFIDAKIDTAVLTHFPNLKLIATRSTGYDHIDLAACAARGVVVSSVPSYGENTVAEFAFALILSLSRKIHQAYSQVRETGSFSFEALQGFDLAGKTLGVIGTGRIGMHTTRMGKGFGMKVVAFDLHPDEKKATDNGFTYVDLDTLLKEADVVSLHVPETTETHHLLSAEKLALMKSTALLINTSRGGIVDTEALARALKEGKLGGAGLDVLEEEGVIRDEADFLFRGHPEGHNLKTIIANHVLIDLPNVIITPHNAFNTREALERILDTTVQNVSAFVSGTPQNVVTTG
jgi:D-lactate dehydrogenase